MPTAPAELVVRAAGFTPVKGMRHRPHDQVLLEEEGALGDRAWCLVDLGARRVLRTVAHPTLVGVLASVDDWELTLRLPDGGTATGIPAPSGEQVTCDYWGREVDLALTAGPHAELVSDWLGTDVRLAAAPRGGVVFGSPVTLLGTASLADLARRAGRPTLVEEAARFRSTLVVATDEPYVEDTWLGQEVRVGEAVLRIGAPVPRCAVVDHHPVSGVRDVRLLQLLAGHRPLNAAREPVLGVNATCVRPGAVAATAG